MGGELGRIDRARVEARMSQIGTNWNDVADKMDMPRGTMNNLKSGQRMGRITRRFFSHLLHLEPEEIWPHLKSKMKKHGRGQTAEAEGARRGNAKASRRRGSKSGTT